MKAEDLAAAGAFLETAPVPVQAQLDQLEAHIRDAFKEHDVPLTVATLDAFAMGLTLGHISGHNATGIISTATISLRVHLEETGT